MIDNVPPLDDPEHDAIRGELARLFVHHKVDLGLAGRDDAEIVANVDDLTAFMMQRHGRALLAGDAAWLERYRWFAEACDRLQADQRAVQLDS